MISLYSGTPGSGKSLHVAEKIYYRLRMGFPVWANFDINLEAVDPKGKIRKKKKRPLPFHFFENREITPQKIIEAAYKYFGVTADTPYHIKKQRIKENKFLVVFDEASIIFNARSWQVLDKSWLSFFSQHRKWGIEVVLIAQFDGMIDKQVRTLIEYEFIHRKISNFGFWGRLISFFVGGFGSSFTCVKMWYPMRQRLGAEFFRGKDKFYRLYDTYADFGLSNELLSAKEVKAQEQAEKKGNTKQAV